METTTPSPSRQAQEVRRAEEKSQRHDTVYYVISTKWWFAWRNYCDFDSSKKIGNSSGYTEPGPISNEPLCDERGMLRQDVLEDDDYVLIRGSVWQLVEGWYGGGPAIKRRLLNDDSGRVEVQLLRFEVRLVQESGEAGEALGEKGALVELSKLDTVNKAFTLVLKAAGIKELGSYTRNTLPYRVWVKPAERDHYNPATGGLDEKEFWRRGDQDLAEADLESWSAIDLMAIGTDQTLESIQFLAEGLRWGALVERKMSSQEAQKRIIPNRPYAWPRDALRNKWRLRIKTGDIIDARDSENRWFDSVVRQVKEDQIHIHFRGWAARWDTWMDKFDQDSVQPLFTHTDNWRKLRRGDPCEIRSEDDKRALWYEARVIELFPSDDPSKDDEVLVQTMMAGQQSSTATPTMPRRLSTQSESLAKMGTHIKKPRSPQPVQQQPIREKRTSGNSSLYTSTSTALTTTTPQPSYKYTSTGPRLSPAVYGRQHHKGHPPAPGAVGLSNLGNTCFMNSMLQCLSHTRPLTEYFLDSERVRSELNEENPLGSGGNIARAYTDFIRDAWGGDFGVVVPSALKRAVGKQASQFMGYQQQDSQEFMSYLLDGLHEDLNRVRKKPYTETLESNGRPDEIVAAESWDRFQLRNQSVVVDTCYGLLRSHITCPNCNHESITFDPYNTLSLPLPSATTRRIAVTLSRADGTRPIKYVISLSGRDTITQLKEGLAVMNGKGIKANNLDVCDIWAHRISRNFGNEVSLENIKSSDDLVAFELSSTKASKSSDSELDAVQANEDDDDDDATVEAIRSRRQKIRRGTVDVAFGSPQTSEQNGTMAAISARGGSSLPSPRKAQMYTLFGSPFRVAYDEKTTCRTLRTAIALRVKRYVDFAFADGKEPYTLVISGDTGTRCITEFPRDDTLVSEAIKRYQLTLEFSKDARIKAFDDTEGMALDLDASAAGQSGRGFNDAKKKNSLEIADCLRKLFEREQLGETEMWYCSKCKKHSRAFKKLDLWNTPDILILHLKRFQYAQTMSFVHRQKLDDLVNFPSEAPLDLSTYVLSNDSARRAKYELYAVSEHSGGLGGGHYTATVYNDAARKWFHYNDAHVSSASLSNIVSKQAYVLFYRRRAGA